jgi:hypothetical protein
MHIFIFRIVTEKKISFFTAVKHIFSIFTGTLPDYFFFNSANAQKVQ